MNSLSLSKSQNASHDLAGCSTVTWWTLFPLALGMFIVTRKRMACPYFPSLRTIVPSIFRFQGELRLPGIGFLDGAFAPIWR